MAQRSTEEYLRLTKDAPLCQARRKAYWVAYCEGSKGYHSLK